LNDLISYKLLRQLYKRIFKSQLLQVQFDKVVLNDIKINRFPDITCTYHTSRTFMDPKNTSNILNIKFETRRPPARGRNHDCGHNFDDNNIVT